ncbi:unnamed protein product [Linum trigynum]|uniref:Uncharacterized protein n=1 Tax=Linum trigynum TaxID=586398 RepID=A0AAV2D1Q9_9ROSI
MNKTHQSKSEMLHNHLLKTSPHFSSLQFSEKCVGALRLHRHLLDGNCCHRLNGERIAEGRDDRKHRFNCEGNNEQQLRGKPSEETSFSRRRPTTNVGKNRGKTWEKDG